MSYQSAFAKTMVHEDGYSNNPADPGGETYMGISRVHHPDWNGWAIIDWCKESKQPYGLADGLARSVTDFYYNEYWMRQNCHCITMISEPVAEELFEASVNCGKITAGRFLQSALNMLNVNGKLYDDLEVDGKIGKVTVAATQRCIQSATYAETLLLRCMNGEQYIHYRNNPRHEYFRGWFARV